MHGNRFTSFPCTFANLLKGNLDELSLEWFLYAKPPRNKLVKKGVQDGKDLFDQMLILCNLLIKYKMNECAMITFLENYSTPSAQTQANNSLFNIDHVDNRMRTPLHNAAVKGDVGVVEGLLLGKANPNTLDKDNCTPLCLSIREDKFDTAVILINSSGVDVNLGGGIFGSPMHLAVVKLEVWIVKKLLMRGADVNKADCDGNTPLHLVMNVFSKNS
jgi:ankyrin repeat protein